MKEGEFGLCQEWNSGLRGSSWCLSKRNATRAHTNTCTQTLTASPTAARRWRHPTCASARGEGTRGLRTRWSVAELGGGTRLRHLLDVGEPGKHQPRDTGQPWTPTYHVFHPQESPDQVRVQRRDGSWQLPGAGRAAVGFVASGDRFPSGVRGMFWNQILVTVTLGCKCTKCP